MNWLGPTTWADADRERLNLLPAVAPENYFPKHSEPTTARVRSSVTHSVQFTPIGRSVMGIFSGLLGNASEVSGEKLDRLFDSILVPGERVEKAYQLIRDMLVFTNKRLILVDKQGVTGKKVELLSVPYSKITKYSKESAGHFDLDAELKIWIGSAQEPLVQKFSRSVDIHEVYRVLSSFVLE